MVIGNDGPSPACNMCKNRNAGRPERIEDRHSIRGENSLCPCVSRSKLLGTFYQRGAQVCVSNNGAEMLTHLGVFVFQGGFTSYFGSFLFSIFDRLC